MKAIKPTLINQFKTRKWILFQFKSFMTVNIKKNLNIGTFSDRKKVLTDIELRYIFPLAM